MELTDLVEHLRNEELDSIRSEVSSGRRDHILKTLDERGRAQELVRQQYTGRYPFELLQNANDASADKESIGHKATFILTHEALLVADMGAGFGPSQIRAICGLGRSTKDPRKTIGYKGLGFKSVGEITDDPQIFSGGAGFRFDVLAVREQVAALVGGIDPDQRLPVYAFPISMSLNDVGKDGDRIQSLLSSGYRTVFRLPFRNDVDRSVVAAHLGETLSPRLLLFLDSIDQLELIGTTDDFLATAVKQRQDDHVEVLVEAREETEHWLVFNREVDIPEPELVVPLGDAWQNVERVRVAAAVPLDDEGLPTRLDPQPIHVYFPTEESSGYGLLLQADFSLELDRRRIAANPEAVRYNTWLAEQLGELIGTVATGLVSRYPDDASIVSSLAVISSPSGIGERVVEEAIASLSRIEFVPTVSGLPRVPGEVLLLPETIPNAVNAHDFLEIGGLGTMVVPGIEEDGAARRMLSHRLDARELSSEEALARLRQPSDELLTQFCEFLIEWSERVGLRRFAQLISKVSCVRTVAGHWRRPDDRLFFPRQRDEVEFPAGLEVPIVDMPAVDGLRPLLEAAGVSSFEWRQLLPEFVFPLLIDPSTDATTRGLGLEALRLYFRTERSGDPRLKAQAARVLLPAATAEGTEARLQTAETIYFSAGWLDDDRLERIYGAFGESEFLSLDPPSDPNLRAGDVEFFEWLGVARHPRPDQRVVEQRDVHMVSSLGRHPHASKYSRLWTDWLDRSDVQAAARCDQGHSASQQLRASYGLDRFPEIVASADPDRLGLLWEELAKNWGTFYREAQSARFYCQHTGHGGERVREAPSLMAHMIEVLDWVPCVRRGRITLVEPGKAWRLTRDTPRRIVERVSVLPPTLDQPWASGLCADLGVVDAARPHSADLIELLKQLASEWEEIREEDPEAKAVIDAARWAMRTLNDVVGDDVLALRAEDVPLLARIDGHRTFHFRPYVSDDTFLAETWEGSLPILDADRDLRTLHTALQLPNLDKLTRQIPVPRGELPEAQAAIRADLDAALPFLAAVAVEAVPSRQDDVYRGLARLELHVCDELSVRYELDGEVRERGEAVAFIAVRQEQEGVIRRNIGTAHLELDPSTGLPHWYVFGPLLARFLSAPTQGDAFSLLLSGSTQSRREYLRSRLIPDEALEEARIRLDQPPSDDDLTDLISGLGDGLQESTVEGVVFASNHRESESGRIPDEPGAAEEESSLDAEELFPDLDHDSISITDAEVGTGESDDGVNGIRGSRGGGLGPAGPVDHARRLRLQRTIGRRGEQVVYEAELRRVEASGQDPRRVVWRSDAHPFAPYDVESIDDDGHTMYVEVKSTTSDDPFEAFEISHAELMWALRHRSRYFVYRVTNAHLRVPSITRFQDPISMLRDGSAELGLSGARLAFRAPN